MDALAAMKAEMDRKRKAVLEAQVISEGKKYFKRGDLLAKEQEQYWRESKRAKKECEIQEAEASSSGTSSEDKEEGVVDKDIPRVEVIKRLRARNKPITLFGESETESRIRLLKHEVEQPELKEGWKNDFQSALKEVDNELVDAVLHGPSREGKNLDVVVPDAEEDWEKMEVRVKLLGEDKNTERDCDILYEYMTFLMGRWAKDLNARSEEEKRSPKGKLDAGSHKQTMEHIRPLLKSLKNHNCNNDIREHLVRICRLMIEREYIQANNAYMEMAIGNAPWPVGVTRSGIHQRPGSAKAYVSNIAHVLNDETQRKYIQAFKRLMGRCQTWFPTDPSKCVEYVKNKS
uniref:Pre-mRNA-splicing factor 18 n=1 Tax=Steinernema glaseri TaxID=37863 RepID=A0A1I7YD82_9BILA